MDFRLDDDQLALQDTVRTFCRTRYPMETIADRPGGPFDRARFGELADLGVLSILVSEERGGLGLGAVEAALVFEQLGEALVPGPLLWTAVAATLIDGAADGSTTFGGAVDDGTPVYALDGLDPLNPIGSFASLPTGQQIGGPAEAERATHVATVLSAAVLLGVAQGALDTAVAYSLEREQFGVPIGSFQALKHMMADMYVRTGLARSQVYAASAVLDDLEVGDVVRTVAAAKLLAGEAALDNSKAAVQVLGGMGFTWEMAPNFFLKRAWVLEQALGTGAFHALALADALATEVSA